MKRLWQKMMLRLARDERVKNFMQSNRSSSGLAKKFVGGSNIPEVLKTCSHLNAKGFSTSFFYMGEYHTDRIVINRNVSQKKKIIQKLQKTHFDIHISVDPTQIGFMVDKTEGANHAKEIARCISMAVKEGSGNKRNFLMIDMEDNSMVDLTLDLYNSLLQSQLPVAITLQAYLTRTRSDLSRIIDAGGNIRLVKGAFAARADIAYTRKKEIDKSYSNLSRMMLSDRAKKMESTQYLERTTVT